MNKKILYIIGIIVLIIVIAGIIKFNFINDDVYSPNEKGEYVNSYGRKVEFVENKKVTQKDNKMNRKDDLCDENGRRYKTAEEAKKAGLTEAQYGATYCPEYKMDPSWDKNNDGINDCYDDNSCSKDLDYMSPRK